VSTAHTPGRITFKEDGDANHYSMLTEDGKWWLAILANGEQTSARQVANFRRLAACWNALQGIDTEYLETHGLPDFAQKISDVVVERDATQARLDTLIAAIGNECLAKFIEKHGEPVPLVAQRDALLSALTALVANQDVSWRHAGFTEAQIQAMPYLKASRDAIAGFVVPS
jgi:hypothetical protein